MNAEGPATTLTVRAHGSLAGDVGPMMQILVDGVPIDTIEVRSTSPADYRFTVPPLRDGTKVDVVFKNDANINGTDRNLFVSQLTAGNTYTLPNAPGVLIDRGTGAAAFDGIDVFVGQAPIYSSGALRVTWPEPNLTDRLTVRASGNLADNVGPTMALRVDGVVVGSTEVRSPVPSDYTFAVPPLAAGSRVEVVYNNDETIAGVDRNLTVAYLMAGTTVLLPNAAGVVYDLGNDLAAFDGSNVQPGQAALTANGALRGKWPAPNMTDTLTVRASGRLAANVGPIMQVRVDGVVLGSIEVRATTPTDHAFATLPMKAGSLVDVAYTNDITVGSEDRDLTVAYLIANTTYLLPTAVGVVVDQGSGDAAFDGLNLLPGHNTLVANGALRGTWPAPNLTDTLTVHAKGSVAGNVGPVMQVLVDGVVVGSTEVRSADFNDYRFAVPSLQVGTKVDVVFTNDATVAGVDRNLFIDYLIAGTTYLRPNAAGIVYDRGAGAAAFDGADTIAGAGTMYWAGALHTTWPAPNLTSSVTVRASGSLAGNIGPIMQVRLDGVIVGSVEVKSPELTDYLLAVAPLKPGSKLDLVFINAETIDGSARTLTVAYLLAGNTVLLPNAAGVVFDLGTDAAAFDGTDARPGQATLTSNGALRASWPSANLTDSMTVRAHGSLAGDTGPIMQVRVNGVVVGSTEVRATEPADYHFAVPPLLAGSKIDVVYTNDGSVNGVDRNLMVAYLISGNTFALSTSPTAVIDRGTGAAATDGIDVVAGQSTIAWNGALRVTWPAPNLTDRVTVRASGNLAGNVGPIMALQVDGVIVGSQEVRSPEPADHTFAVPPLMTGSRVDVVYLNDEIVNGEDRNLTVAYLMAGNTVLLPTAPGVVYDLGAGLAAFDGANMLPGQTTLAANGALRAKWPAPNMTERITVRASGRPAVNVGPLMQLRVDGVVVGTAEVRATTPTDYHFAVLPMQPGSQVDVAYTNDAIVNGEDRNLTVHYLISGKATLLPTAAGVVYDLGSGSAAFDGVDVLPGRATMGSNGALRASWPVPNLTDSLTVHARGSLAGNVGPVVQLHVDGVIVGTAEVRSATFTDYTFSTPPLQPGSKVDVVFTNDALINGDDRNLYIAYLVAGNTSVLPSAPGAVIDRGAGAAAFDGTSVIAGQDGIYGDGALRVNWPAPNITDSITVRASGTVAGNVGPIMQVRVDGIVVSSVEVRASTPTDYLMAVPPLRVGSKIDVIYTNDDIVNGVDRNLNVAYLIAGSTFMLPSSQGVVFDLGSGAAAFDGLNLLLGQGALGSNGALRMTWPTPNVIDSIVVRASGSLAANVGPLMQLRVNGVIMGTAEVRSSSAADYVFATPRIPAGSKIDLAFVNDAWINGQDRNLFIQYLKVGNATLVPTAPTVQLDTGVGEAAFDGADTAPSTGAIFGFGALRFTMPTQTAPDMLLAARQAASRFLQQATFGPTLAEIDRLATLPFETWLAEQMALPATADYVSYVQSKYDLGDDYRPNGTKYTNSWVGQRFWATAANSPDQLRKRVAFALHQIFMVSQADSNLYYHSRAYANYLDTLNLYAFGNFRTLLEEVALSPAMGIYLSHMRNRKEDPLTGRLPDENFAREVMQLFTIGLHELNDNGTAKLGPNSQPIETYSNNDVMALAKAFTGWSWAFPDSQLTEHKFRYGNFDYSVANDQRIDLQKMKPYPGQHSTAEKRLFAGTVHTVTIPANSTAQDSLRMALDALFLHPNVGPFIGRQLIQRLVTSQPSPAYVGRVAAKFNNNGAGVRGDLAAVVRAVLMDSEARSVPTDAIGKLREPVLRITHWMRSFDAKSTTGHYLMAYELDNQTQRVFNPPSVFGYFRPGFVPPNTAFSDNSITVPELQIVDESTTAQWVNMAMSMVGSGVGWTGTARDVSSKLAPLVALASASDVDGLIDRIDLLLYAGRMSRALRQDMLDAITTVSGTTATSHQNRARVALFLALSSPEYLVQR